MTTNNFWLQTLIVANVLSGYLTGYSIASKGFTFGTIMSIVLDVLFSVFVYLAVDNLYKLAVDDLYKKS